MRLLGGATRTIAMLRAVATWLTKLSTPPKAGMESSLLDFPSVEGGEKNWQKGGCTLRHGGKTGNFRGSHMSTTPHTPTPPVFLTSAELADRWKVTPMTLRRWRASKKLKAHHLGGTIRFSISEIERIERDANS